MLPVGNKLEGKPKSSSTVADNFGGAPVARKRRTGRSRVNRAQLGLPERAVPEHGTSAGAVKFDASEKAFRESQPNKLELARTACAVSLASLALLVPGAAAVELSGRHQLTVEREWLEDLILETAQSRLQTLSDDDLLQVFRDVVKGKAPKTRAQDTGNEASRLPSWSPFQDSLQPRDRESNRADYPAGNAAEQKLDLATPSLQRTGAVEQRSQTAGISQQSSAKDSFKKEASGELSKEPQKSGSSSGANEAERNAEELDPEGETPMSVAERSDATATLLESSGVKLPPINSADDGTSKAARGSGLQLGGNVLRGGLEAVQTVARGVGGALTAAAMLFQNSSAAVPAASLAGLVVLIFVFLRIVADEEDGEEGEPQQASKKSPQDEKAASKQKQKDETAAKRPDAVGGGLTQLRLKPLTDIPEALRQLPALSLLSRLVKEQTTESAGSKSEPPSSQAESKAEEGRSGRKSQRLPEQQQGEEARVSMNTQPRTVAPQNQPFSRGQPSSSLQMPERVEGDTVLWRRRESPMQQSGNRATATLDCSAGASDRSAPPGSQSFQAGSPPPGPILWQRRGGGYQRTSLAPSSAARLPRFRERGARQRDEAEDPRRGPRDAGAVQTPLPRPSSRQQQRDTDSSSEQSEEAGSSRTARSVRAQLESSTPVLPGAGQVVGPDDTDPQIREASQRHAAQAGGGLSRQAVLKSIRDEAEGGPGSRSPVGSRVAAEEQKGLPRDSGVSPVSEGKGMAALRAVATPQQSQHLKDAEGGRDQLHAAEQADRLAQTHQDEAATSLESQTERLSSAGEAPAGRTDREAAEQSPGPHGSGAGGEVQPVSKLAASEDLRWPLQRPEGLTHEPDARKMTGSSPQSLTKPLESFAEPDLLPTAAAPRRKGSAEPAEARPRQPVDTAGSRIAPGVAVLPDRGSAPEEETCSVEEQFALQGTFLTDGGSSSTDDESCFPRQRDRDAFRQKQAHRRKSRRALWLDL